MEWPNPVKEWPVPKLPPRRPSREISVPRAKSRGVTDPADMRLNDHVPLGIRVAASWSWRLIVIGALIYVLTQVIGGLAEVLIPVAIALLITAGLKPIVDFFDKHLLPRSLAAAAALLLGIAAIGGLITLVVWQIQTNIGDLSQGVTDGLDKVRDSLRDNFGVSSTQLDNALTTAQGYIRDNTDKITEGAVSTATTLAHVITGLLVVLFSTFFFLKDGRYIWLWVVRVLVPKTYEDIADEAGLRAWGTLGGYVRATVLVAAIDAICIAFGVFVVGVPLAIPIGVLVFLFSFVPLFGATLSGMIAVLIALVFEGPIAAIIVLAIVLGVQQLEGHILQPFIMSRSVSVHPLAVVIGITSGVTVAGIIGALVAVPIIAMANTVGTYLANQDPGEAAKLEAEAEAEGAPVGSEDKGTMDQLAPNTSVEASDPNNKSGV
ncbi:MAG: family transporter [Jatrophihabitantaceae bacterium]|nr:family transporter [Jatrophihabitantaceae bacterium]